MAYLFKGRVVEHKGLCAEIELLKPALGAVVKKKKKKKAPPLFFQSHHNTRSAPAPKGKDFGGSLKRRQPGPQVQRLAIFVLGVLAVDVVGA